MSMRADSAGNLPAYVALRARLVLFAVSAFLSATLIFALEPMIAQMLLPKLGGAPAVWNTSLAFFQIALLAGYLYAHQLQRLGVRHQIVLHVLVLLAASLCFPLRVIPLFGAPPLAAPISWLLATLAVSIGLPFAALSATAPLVQAWYARSARHPYGLYVASNLGSLVALLAYPVLIEPALGLKAQGSVWTAAYGLFVLVVMTVGATIWQTAGGKSEAATSQASLVTAKDRLTWLALAAVPSSLLLGVTNFVTSEIGSAPFLWIIPLALYLVTFIVAFSQPEIIRRRLVQSLQAPVMALCALVFWVPATLSVLSIHLACFFLSALLCHQALYARRPRPDRLTEFYIWVSVGGVIGGAFNAFVAPQLFNSVIEYPAALFLACLARPRGPMSRTSVDLVLISLLCAVVAILAAGRSWTSIAFASLTIAAAVTLLLRSHAIAFAIAILGILVGGNATFDRTEVIHRWRDFFGVATISHEMVSRLGDVKLLRNGTTLHGAQYSVPELRCKPTLYYAPETPIGQVVRSFQSRLPRVNIGVIGLGAGVMAAYTRPGDSLTFFEINPLLIKIASDPQNFTYLSLCAKGHISYVSGDGRTALAQQRSSQYDILLIDAFSSDAVPSHLLTVEALRLYLAQLRSDGVLVLHLSNRNLDLARPALAGSSAVGAYALEQTYMRKSNEIGENLWAANEQAVIVGRSIAALEPFAADRRWRPSSADGVRAWTDDYIDVFGAMLRRSVEKK